MTDSSFMGDTVFVQRDGNGAIVGVFAYICEGVAEEELPADDPDVVAFMEYVPPPPPYMIPASLPWVRMTGPEADAVSAAITAAPARTRSIVNSATFFTEGTEPFTLFHDLIAETLTPARADEIMAPAS